MNKVLLSLLVLLVVGCGWVSEAGQVAREEVGPRASVRKYEWFKDMSSNIAAKSSMIDTQQAALTKLEEKYKDREMPNAVQLSFNQRETELLGLKASYNKDVAEYNSNMAKVNHSYANVGAVPAGASALPKEFITR